MLLNKLLKTTSVVALCLGMAGTAFAEPTVLRVVIKDVSESNPLDAAHMARIEAAMAAQGTEIDIQLVDLPAGGYADKLNLMLLSGDTPDLIYFQGGDEQIANQDLLLDWRPLLENTEYLKKGLWPHNVARLDNYPYLLYPFAARTKAPLIRTDWLAEVGGAPNSLDEWTDMLRAVSASDFDGDGVKNTYGIMAPGNTKELDAVFNQAFGVTGSWIQNGGEWVDARVSDEERAKLGYYHMLYADGLLDPEFITKNWEVKEDDLYAGRVGVVMGTAGGVVGIYEYKLQQVAPDSGLTMLLPPLGVAQGLQATSVAKETRGFAVSALSEHPEMAVALMDFMASPEGQMMERMGFEGTHYTDTNGTIALTEESGNWWPRFLVVNPSAWTAPIDLLSPVAQASMDQGVRFFSADNAFVYPSDMAVDVDAAENLYRTSVFRFISGEMSLEDDWGQYVSDFNAAGGANLTTFARTVLK